MSRAGSSGKEMKKHSQWRDVWQRLMYNKLAMVGFCIVILLILVAIFADVIAPYDYAQQDLNNTFSMPCLAHPFGTDNYGRDILSRVMYGGRISLLVSFMACAISVIAGGLIGAMAGYFGGWFESVVMRLLDILMAIPGIMLSVCLSALLGSGVWQTALAISISGIAPTCRVVRATVLTIRDQEYIEAAVLSGSKNMRIILKHVIPNALAPLIVQATLGIGGNIIMISSLSFIGLGVQPPTPEWGSILNAGRQYIRDFWPLITFPGLAIMLTMFGFNMLGDGLRDALDPRLKR